MYHHVLDVLSSRSFVPAGLGAGMTEAVIAVTPSETIKFVFRTLRNCSLIFDLGRSSSMMQTPPSLDSKASSMAHE